MSKLDGPAAYLQCVRPLNCVMSKPSWSLRRFRLLVGSRRDTESTLNAEAAANGLVRESHFASFHAYEAISVVDAARRTEIKPGEGPGMAAFRQFMDEFLSGDGDRPLREASFKAAAHSIAFFRSLHAATDLLAPVIYWGLGLREELAKPLSEASINPTNVASALASLHSHSKVEASLLELLSNPSFKYVRALSNSTKHRSLVPAGFSVSYDFSPDPKHGVRIGRFQYGQEYSPRWVSDYIQDCYPDVIRGMIAVGRAVNADLASQPRLTIEQSGLT